MLNCSTVCIFIAYIVRHKIIQISKEHRKTCVTKNTTYSMTQKQ